jgi:hypothetical protein
MTDKTDMADKTTQTAEEPKFRIVTLSDRAPVRINEDVWPLIASGDETFENPFGTTGRAAIMVRQHADRRVLCYGWMRHRPGYHEELEIVRVGHLDRPGTLVQRIDAIRDEMLGRAEIIGAFYAPEMIAAAHRECIADLPAETLD